MANSIQGDSAEAVALELLEIVAYGENKGLRGNHTGRPAADRAWILDTYAECLRKVRLPKP